MILGDLTQATPDTFRLALLGDTHCGNLATSYKSIQKATNRIKKDRNCYWGFLGDAIEAVYVMDKRFKEEIHAGRHSTVNAQCKLFADTFKPIKDKLMFLLDGNHESKIAATADVAEMIRDYMDGDFLYGSVEGKFKFSDNFSLYVHHGYGSVNSRAEQRSRRMFNDADSIRRKLMDMSGDCVVSCMAHIHKMRIRPPDEQLLLVGARDIKQIFPTYTDYNGPSIDPQHKWYCSTGSFLRTKLIGKNLDTYSAIRMYSPGELGFLMVHVKKGVVVDVTKESV